MRIKQKIAWFSIALVCILTTVLFFAPATWLGMALAKNTGGRLDLGDAEGSLWNGSAFIGVAADRHGDLTPLLPGRFSWHLSPILLLGQIDLALENSASLSQPVSVTGNFRHLQIGPSAVKLPSERLVGLGAPLNTLKPAGEITLSWDPLSLSLAEGGLNVDGTMKLSMDKMASALSPIKPLGSYLLSFVWHGQSADLELKTLSGALLLTGKGAIVNGQLQFSGEAQARDGDEDKLVNLLNLLGQRKPGVDKFVIGLEFK